MERLLEVFLLSEDFRFMAPLRFILLFLEFGISFLFLLLHFDSSLFFVDFLLCAILLVPQDTVILILRSFLLLHFIDLHHACGDYLVQARRHDFYALLLHLVDSAGDHLVNLVFAELFFRHVRTTLHF